MDRDLFMGWGLFVDWDLLVGWGLEWETHDSGISPNATRQLRSPAASCPGFALQHGLLQKFWFNYMLSAFTTHVTIYFLVLLHIDSQCNFRLDYTFSHCSAQISQTHERDQRVEIARGLLPRVCASAWFITKILV